MLYKRFFNGCVCFAAGLLITTVVSAQDNEYLENKSILEISPTVLSGGLPQGWHIRVGESAEDAGALTLVRVAEDGSAIVITPATEKLTLASPLIPVQDSCTTISGAIQGKGGGKVEAVFQWLSGEEVIETIPFREPPVSNEANRRFNLPETERPETADAMQLLLTVAPSETGTEFHCTTIRVNGTFMQQRNAALFCNKIGYDQVGSKRFTAYANFMAQEATFTINDIGGATVFSGSLTSARIQGAEGAEWDGYYYRGDFSAFEKEGEYTITVHLDNQPPVTTPILIGFNLLWKAAFAPVLAPFQRFRADAADTLQLWDAPCLGDTTEPALLWDLVRSWSILLGRFSNDPVFKPLNDEALYGLEKIAQWVIAHGGIAADDLVAQTYYATSLACGAHFYPGSASILEAAKLLAEEAMKNNLEGVLPFSIAMDMFDATKDQRYFEYAQRIFPGVSIHRVEPLLSYEGNKGENVSIVLNTMFNTISERIIKNSENPFGISKSVAEGQRGFFLSNADAPAPLRGSSARILALTEVMAQAHRYATGPEKQDYVYDQFNWLLGNNPFGACLVAGLCAPDNPLVFLPDGMTINDIQGFVLHGIGPRSVNEDIPSFSVDAAGINENTNGFSLANNARYISAMAYLKRIPVARPL